MRPVLYAAALAAIALPAAAQPPAPPPYPPRPSEEIERYAPAVDRAADALLNLDLGPILDAVDPYRPHRHHTLREFARRDDPGFEQRLHRSIYGSAAVAGRAADAAAAAEPALRRAVRQFERDMNAALAGAPPPRGRPGAAPDRGAGEDPWGD
jgi:hypothetical protein